MSSAQKRKTSPAAQETDDEPAKRRFVETETSAKEPATDSEEQVESSTAISAPEPATPTSDAAAKSRDRLERFKALQARQSASRKQNMKESAAESQRFSTDPNLLNSLQRKRDIANHKLLKADTAAAGDDFERKRAWDWTIEESEKWDRRMAKKEKHREDVAFQDHRQDARKVYKRQLRELKPDMEAYEHEKMEAIQKSAQSGSLEIVETEDGELIAVDKDGTFYSTADSTDFVRNKPDKAAVDRLVADIRKVEEARLKRRRERGRADDGEGDVTYINQKNAQFNQKLKRFYDKYTADIRESFERGTAI